MNAFVVVFTEPSAEAGAHLKGKFSDSYELVENTVFLVRSDELSSDVAIKAGIKSEPRVSTGAVFKMNHAYAGYTSKTLWEWLGE